MVKICHLIETLGINDGDGEVRGANERDSSAVWTDRNGVRSVVLSPGSGVGEGSNHTVVSGRRIVHHDGTHGTAAVQVIPRRRVDQASHLSSVDSADMAN